MAPPFGRRAPPLQGGRNFRDLGGYRAGAGRRVRWGRLYRSGSMAGLTAGDCEYLSGLGIRWICDLRTTSEREAAPNAWHDGAPLCWSRDYAMSLGDLRRFFGDGPTSAAQMREMMLAVYRQLPFEQAPAYRELFARLAGGDLPLIINCTAGKDRTGIAAALILGALGVQREAIVEDYMLTNALLAAQPPSGALHRRLGHLPANVVRAVLGSDADYLEAAFSAIDERHGSVGTYLREALCVDADALAAIRRELLEDAAD
ncbi:MAG: tyrosine-protein phosphatase [Solimonas sp.]